MWRGTTIQECDSQEAKVTVVALEPGCRPISEGQYEGDKLLYIKSLGRLSVRSTLHVSVCLVYHDCLFCYTVSTP